MVARSLLQFYRMQVCLGAALGISKPSALLWFKSDLFTYGLGFLMLSMGLTLTIEDFKQVKQPTARESAARCMLSYNSCSKAALALASNYCSLVINPFATLAKIICRNFPSSAPLCINLLCNAAC